VPCDEVSKFAGLAAWTGWRRGEERARRVTRIGVDRVIFVCIVDVVGFLGVGFQSDVRTQHKFGGVNLRVTGVGLSKRGSEME